MDKHSENTWHKNPTALPGETKGSSDKGLTKAKVSHHYASSDDTFGDNERKAVKAFLAAYEERGPNLTEDINHIKKIADLYVKSAMHTQNVYNLLRASGLLNLCLRLAENGDDEAMIEHIRRCLIEFENAALKRCLKLKPAQISQFDHMLNKERHQQALNEMKRIYEADMNLMLTLIKELPDIRTILNKSAEEQRKKLMLLEDKIIALHKVMTEEALQRRIELFKVVLLECVTLIGGDPPCQYALTVNSRWRPGLASTNEPISCYILIEKNDMACKVYFRNLLTLFGMKIINLCETSLLYLNIKALNWFTEGTSVRGLALYDFIDDTEKKYFTSIPMESVFTIKELMAAAQSSTRERRAAIKEICDGIHLVTGSQKLFKQMCALRSIVIQREHGDRDNKTNMLEKLKAIIAPSEILDIEYAQKKETDHLRSKLNSFVTTLTDVVFDLEKELSVHTTTRRLEELAIEGSDFCYADIVLNTAEYGDTLQSKLSVPQGSNLSPRLNELIPAQFQKKKDTKNISGTGIVGKDGDDCLANGNGAEPILKELRRKKQDLVENGSDFYRGYIIKSNGELLGYTKRVTKHISDQTIKLDDSVDEESNSDEAANCPDFQTNRPMIQSLKPKYIPENRIKPKNASNRVGPQPKPHLGVAQHLPEKPVNQRPIDRYVSKAEVGSPGKLASLSPSAFRALLLLNCYSTIMPQLDRKWEISKAKKGSEGKNVCLRMLQITVPLLEHLEPVMKQQNITVALRKALQNLDMKQLQEDELAAAVMNIYSGKYDQACLAVYKYLENRSDITFVGEPYVTDFIEVGEELLEEEVLSHNRFTFLLEVMGFSKKMTNDFQNSMEYYNQLLSMIEHSDRLKRLEATKQIVLCCLHMGKKEKGLQIITQITSELRGTRVSKQEKDVREQLGLLQLELEQISC